MAIQTEVWVRDIEEKLFAGNEFVKNSISHDAFVDNLTVHIPQAGTIPAVQKNRAVFPATITQRTDTDRTYNLAEYTTDPILIRDLEETQTSYPKRSSVMDHHIRKINDRLGLEALNVWAGTGVYSSTNTTGQIVLSTGTAATSLRPPSSTLALKGVTLADMEVAAAKLSNDDVPIEGRYMVMPAFVYYNFVEANKATLLSLDFQGGRTASDIAMGIVAKVYGWNIIVRSYTVVYTDGATPTKKAVGAAAAATDTWGCVGWQMDTVAKAKGAIKVYADNDKPEYYGSVISAKVDFAAAQLRDDAKGIVTIVLNT